MIIEILKTMGWTDVFEGLLFGSLMMAILTLFSVLQLAMEAQP